MENVEVNVKTKYRPFKRQHKHCLKNNVNIIIIPSYKGETTFMKNGDNNGKIKLNSSKAGTKRKAYASIKGCCKLRKDGNLM